VADDTETGARSRTMAREAARAGAVPVELVPGRTCGTCMMCCKLYALAELKKRAGEWCGHAERGRGCGIYESRPGVCQDFYCAWRLDPALGSEWKPDKARFVVATDVFGYNALTVTLDPGMPQAWKKEPYYAAIKSWAARFLRDGKKILVVDSRGFVTVVLPDRDVPLGVIGQGEEIAIYREGSNYGVRLQRAASLEEPSIRKPPEPSI
jgi:hypothetical protein